jgi:hypothetical protein
MLHMLKTFKGSSSKTRSGSAKLKHHQQQQQQQQQHATVNVI